MLSSVESLRVTVTHLCYISLTLQDQTTKAKLLAKLAQKRRIVQISWGRWANCYRTTQPRRNTPFLLNNLVRNGSTPLSTRNIKGGNLFRSLAMLGWARWTASNFHTNNSYCPDKDSHVCLLTCDRGPGWHIQLRTITPTVPPFDVNLQHLRKVFRLLFAQTWWIYGPPRPPRNHPPIHACAEDHIRMNMNKLQWLCRL